MHSPPQLHLMSSTQFSRNIMFLITTSFGNNSSNSSASSSNSSGNSNSLSQFSLLRQVTMGASAPFVFIFFFLFLIVVINYAIQFKNLARNQHILFGLIFGLLVILNLNMWLREATELMFLINNSNTMLISSSIIKGLARVCNNLGVLLDILIMAHISMVFLSISFGFVSAFKVADESILTNLLLGLMLFTSLLFLISITIFSIILNYSGRLLRRNLKIARDRADSLRKSLNNKNSPDKSLEISLQMKKKALRNATLLQYGITISMILQFCGFLFIPFALLWPYCTVIYHGFYNIGYISLVCFLLAIYSPLHQVQTLFRKISVSKRESPRAAVHVESGPIKSHESGAPVVNRSINEIISEMRDFKAVQTSEKQEFNEECSTVDVVMIEEDDDQKEV